MKTLLTVIVSLTLLLGTFTLTNAYAAQPNADSDWVYLIKNHNQGLKNVFGVRHNFDVGFTTILNENQVPGLERGGLEIEKVPLYQITKPPGACDPWPKCKSGGGDDGGDTTRQFTPSDQTPWGIEKIYNNIAITSTSGGNGVNVALLDTGVNKDHLDLKSRITDCKDFTKGPMIKNTCKDGNGHGTHTAGTILADGGFDNLGIYGVAPDANLMAYKVCSSGCWTDDIAAAIDFAGNNGANIISMSLGGDSQSSLISAAIARNPHVLIVAAAGNDGPADGSIDYPGANSNVVAVGAIDVNVSVPIWSSRGVNDGDGTIEEREVEFGAPGVAVESTWNDGSYNTISGTSMATPHVSGLAAKFWQGNADNTRIFLQNLASDIWTAGEDTATGLGLPQVP